MVEPRLLQPGDKVAVTAASGPCNIDNLEKGVKVLEGFGLNVKIFDSCYARHGNYLAGDVARRVRDLHDAFTDTDIKGIFMARGGYGAAQLLPYINFSMVAKNPKVFVGFSDVTALHTAINNLSGLITFHGPMVASCFGTAGAETMSSLWDGVALGKWAGWGSVEYLYKGSACGVLTGGNLTVIASTIGTPYEIETTNRILFLEEIGEAPYRIDRLLLQLNLAGKLRAAAGFALGDFSPESLATLHTAIAEHILPHKKPTIWGVQSGHTSPNFTLPLGRVVTL